MTLLRSILAVFLVLVASAPAQSAERMVTIKPVGAQALGRADAPLTMVEFSDYECTHCQQYHATAFAEIKRDFIDTGKLRYVARDFPLPAHRDAVRAARAARCASEQGRFWEMRSAVFTSTERLDADTLVEIGRGAGLDAERLRACIASGRHLEAIRGDVDAATRLGVHATPTFVLGRSEGDGVRGARFAGAMPYADFAARIKALLEAPEDPAPGSAPR